MWVRLWMSSFASAAHPHMMRKSARCCKVGPEKESYQGVWGEALLCIGVCGILIERTLGPTESGAGEGAVLGCMCMCLVSFSHSLGAMQTSCRGLSSGESMLRRLACWRLCSSWRLTFRRLAPSQRYTGSATKVSLDAPHPHLAEPQNHARLDLWHVYVCPVHLPDQLRAWHARWQS